MSKSKKILSTLLALVLCVSLGATAHAADPGAFKTEPATDEWIYLHIVDQGITVYAPVSDAMKYVDASNGPTKAQALSDLISNPYISVTELDSSLFAAAPADSDVIEVEPVPARSPGTWTITPHFVPSGGTTQYGPHDISWGEVLAFQMIAAAAHSLGWSCATSLPYLAPIATQAGVSVIFCGLTSGSYYVYVKNFDQYDMTVTGGSVQVYTPEG